MSRRQKPNALGEGGFGAGGARLWVGGMGEEGDAGF